MEMNNQPLNLLTTAMGGENRPNATTSATVTPSNRQATTSNQQQINNERQLALANLFSSLSSLANSQQHHQHRHHQQQQQQQQSTTISSGNTQLAHQQAHTLSPPPPSPLQSLAATTSISSIQSVMAAAMMQQQLVNAAKQQQQPQASPAASIRTDQFSHKIHQNTQLEVHRQQQQQQQQRINYCTICNKELCNKYFMKTHMLKMHKISLEMEQPEDEEIECQQGRDDEASPNNETNEEQSNSNDAPEQLQSDCMSSKEHWSPNNANNNNNNKPIKKPTKDSPTKKPAIASTSNKPATSVLNGFAGNSMGGVVCDICNKELCSKYFLKVHKQNTHGVMTDYQDANQFMYPFAPACGPNPFMAGSGLPSVLSNPMAFVQTPPPLSMFSNPSSCKLEEVPKSMGTKKSKSSKKLRLSSQRPVKQEVELNQSSLLPTAEKMNIEKLNESNTPIDPFDGSNKQFESVYRLILAQQQRQQQPPPPPPPQPPQPIPMSTPQLGMSLSEMASNPLSAFMCFGAMGPTSPFGAAMSPAMIVDNILRNQHLFNRTNNAASSSSSVQSSSATNKAAPGTDRNNNNNNNSNDSKQATNNKASKDSASSSNSRYFSHYTEACPMCDRRFKSIKWLKTHMMNDHKQEIATYMQMMMQYLYTSKSQQMAAAATMAAIEQQQHQTQLTQQFTHLPQSQTQPTSLLNKCFGQDSSYQQQPRGNMVLVDQDLFKMSTFSQQQQQQQQPQPPPDMRLCSSEFNVHHQGQLQQPLGLNALDNYAIDARYRQESSSPGHESLNRHSSNSPSSGSSQLLNFNNNNNETNLNCGINFELSKLSEHRRHKSDEYLSASPCDEGSESAEGEDEDAGSDKSRDAD